MNRVYVNLIHFNKFTLRALESHCNESNGIIYALIWSEHDCHAHNEPTREMTEPKGH